jgi:DNA-binding transcriptional ArsR family regulator
MVKSRLDRVFHALADGTRRSILERLTQGQETLGELARPFGMTLPAVMKHVTVLEEAGLVESGKDGRVRRVRMRPQAMKDAAAWIERYREFWTKQFESLERYLREKDA